MWWSETGRICPALTDWSVTNSINEDAIYILASEDDQIIGGSRLVPTTRQVKLVRYIRDMSREMAKMANTASFDFLSYLLYLVVAEAQSLSNSELTGDSEDSLQN